MNGGGVALYVCDDMNATRVFGDIVTPHLEVLWVEVEIIFKRAMEKLFTGRQNLLWYQEERNTRIINLVDTIRMMSNSATFLIIRDVNDLKTLLTELHTLPRQIVTKPIRGNAVLDKILTDMWDNYHDPVMKGDQMVISLKQRNGQSPWQTLRYYRWAFYDSYVRSFEQWLTQADWSDLN